jgi:hypothetical protein
MRKHKSPTEIHLGDNPFAHALAESAGGTYLALADAGLAERFNPLPTSPEGFSLVSLLFASSRNAPLLDKLAQRLIGFGLDVCQEGFLPEDYGISTTLARIGAETASVAAMAMMRSIDNQSEGFWRGLSREQLQQISPLALPMAASLPQPNLGAMRAMLEAGADANGICPNGQPVVGVCDHDEALRLLVQFGADLRVPCPARSSTPSRREGLRLDLLLADASEYDQNRKARLFAIEWAGANPSPNHPGAEVASVAFTAIKAKDKKVLGACLAALGSKHINAHVNNEGATLGVAAARAGLHAEAEKIALACGPFDVAPCGASTWGALLARVHKAGSGREFGTKRDAERLHKALGAIASSRWEPDWSAPKDTSKPSLAESLLGKIPLPEFLGHIESARAAGFDMRSPFTSGMDAPCALLCWLASTFPDERGQAAQSHWALGAEALREFPPSQSSPQAKAAFAKSFLWASEHRMDGLSTSVSHMTFRDFFKMAQNNFASVGSTQPSRPDEQVEIFMAAESLLLEGMEILGRLGEPEPERLNMPSSPHHPFPADALAKLRGLYERGALSMPSTTPKASVVKPGPRL